MVSEITFSVAIEVLLDKGRITRKEWEDKRSYVIMADDILSIHKAGESNETLRPWIISEADLMADDWIKL